MAAVELLALFFDFVEKITQVKACDVTTAVFCLLNVVTETNEKYVY